MIPSCLLALEEICPGHWGGLHPGTLYLASEQQDGRKFKENAQKQDHPGERRRLRTLNLHFDVERERENESVSEETRLGNNIKTLNKGNKRRQKELESWNGNKDADICACTLSKHSYTCLCMLNDCVSLIPQLCVCVCMCTLCMQMLLRVCGCVKFWSADRARTHHCSPLSSVCRQALGSPTCPSIRKRGYQHRWSKAEMLENKVFLRLTSGSRPRSQPKPSLTGPANKMFGWIWGC